MKFPCRLDKYLAHATHYSRNQVKAYIKQKRVKVNNTIETKAQHLLTNACEISLNDQVVKVLGERYYMLHKPSGYLSTKAEATHPSAIALISDPMPDQLHSAGRLDVDTTGLLLLTTDGVWSHKVTSPRSAKNKGYQVTLAEPLTTASAERLRQGILLKGESKATLPAQLDCHSPTQIDIFICEGRYHQIKRMFAAEGNRVVKLHRFSIGKIVLDPQLAIGDSRLLTESEIRCISD